MHLDPYYRLRPVHTRLYVRVRETGDWDLFQACGKWRVFSPGAAACHSQSVSQNGLSRLNSIFSSNVGIELVQSDKLVKIKFGLNGAAAPRQPDFLSTINQSESVVNVRIDSFGICQTRQKRRHRAQIGLSHSREGKERRGEKIGIPGKS